MIIYYSQMPIDKIISEGLRTFRDAKFTSKNNKKEIDNMRTRLAQRQYDKLHNVESFKELERCQKLMFEEIKMKRYQPAFKQVIKEDAEEDKSIKMIKDLIDLDWEKDEDAQHQALAMVKGLVLADTKSADKFLTDLSTYTSKMSIEDYSGKQEEGCKKKPKKKDLKEIAVNVNNKTNAAMAIEESIIFLGEMYSINSKIFYDYIGTGIANGIEQSVSNMYPEYDINDPFIYKNKVKTAKLIFQQILRHIKM